MIVDGGPVFQPEVQVQGGEAGAGGAEGGETEPPDTTVQGGCVLDCWEEGEGGEGSDLTLVSCSIWL